MHKDTLHSSPQCDDYKGTMISRDLKIKSVAYGMSFSYFTKNSLVLDGADVDWNALSLEESNAKIKRNQATAATK
ncbi:hypothetical protein DFQ28_011066 [Apophysomyces sp. BC1034]|nr:hypothetical protein DFQ29_009534 [Apophysomyces sp. BC1021]KAG0184484.1 hypothetical protein DFQ28_011066 [Apophysomyces sp. BC1034]